MGIDKDVTMNVKNTIIPFIQRTGERSLTIIQLISHLRGKKVPGRKFDDHFKGSLRQFSENEIKKIILQLLIRKILKEYFHQNSHSVISYLRFGEYFEDINKPGFKIYIVVSGGKRKGNISKMTSNTNTNYANDLMMRDKPEENCLSLEFQDEPNKHEEDKNNRDLGFDPESYNYYRNDGKSSLDGPDEVPNHNEQLTNQDLSNKDDETLLSEFDDDQIIAELDEIKEMSQTQQEYDRIAEEIHNLPDDVLFCDPMSRIKLEHCILAIRKPVLEMVYRSEGKAKLEVARNVFTFKMFGKIIDLLLEETFSAEEIVHLLDLPEQYNRYKMYIITQIKNSYNMIKEEERLSKPLFDLPAEKDDNIQDELNKLSKSEYASTNASTNLSLNHTTNEERKQGLQSRHGRKFNMAGFKPPIRGPTSPVKPTSISMLSVNKRGTEDNASPSLQAYDYIDHDNNRAVEELGKYKVDFVKAGNSRGWGGKKNWRGKKKPRKFK